MSSTENTTDKITKEIPTVQEPLKTEETITPNETEEKKDIKIVEEIKLRKEVEIKQTDQEVIKPVEVKTSPFLENKDVSSVQTMDEIDKTQIKIEQINFEKKNIKDRVLFRERCKLYRMNQETKKFDVRGEGEILITEDFDSKKYKISMIRDQIKTFGCNHFIDPRSECLEVKSYKNALLWYSLTDTCNTGRNDSPKQIFLVRFKEESICEEYKEIYEEGRKINKEILEKEENK